MYTILYGLVYSSLLHGATALACVVALRHVMEKEGLHGTLKFYGTPAEENYGGKVFMVKDGPYDGLAAYLSMNSYSTYFIHSNNLNMKITLSGGAGEIKLTFFLTSFLGKYKYRLSDSYNENFNILVTWNKAALKTRYCM